MAIPRSKMSNDPGFLDTSGWIALLNSREARHVEANRIWKDFGNRRCVVFLTDWVIGETGSGLSGGGRRELFAKSLRVFMAANIRIVYVDGDLLGKALGLYESRQD